MWRLLAGLRERDNRYLSEQLRPPERALHRLQSELLRAGVRCLDDHLLERHDCELLQQLSI